MEYKDLEILKNESMRKARYGISTLEEVLKKYYSGIGFTELASYIYKERLMDKINFAVDNYNLQASLDRESLITVAQLVRIYISKYLPVDKCFYDFFVNYSEGSLDEDLSLLKETLPLEELPTCDVMKRYALRFNKLGLINLNNVQVNKIYKKYKYLQEKMVSDKKEKIVEEDRLLVEYNRKIKFATYEPIIKKAYDMHQQNIDIDTICSQIDGTPGTFYESVTLIKDSLDDCLKEFAVKLSKYNYNKYLIKQCHLEALCDKYETKEELYNTIYEKYFHVSCDTFNKRIERYVKFSPTVTDRQRRYLERVKKGYAEFFAEKEAEIKSERLEKKHNEILNRSIKVITSFINSGKDIDEFLEENNIEKTVFNHSVYTLQKYEHPLLLEYNNYLHELHFERDNRAIAVSKLMVDLIKYGVDDGGVAREFDIFDYYSITDLPFDELMNIVKDDLSACQYTWLSTFMRENTPAVTWDDKNIKELLSAQHFLNVDFDGKDHLKSSGRRVTMREKLTVISQLRELDIPINNVTYYTCLNRQVLGFSLDNFKKYDSKQQNNKQKEKIK